MTASRCVGRKRACSAACQDLVRTMLVEVKMAEPEAFHIAGLVLMVWFMPRTIKSSYGMPADIFKVLYSMSCI